MATTAELKALITGDASGAVKAFEETGRAAKEGIGTIPASATKAKDALELLANADSGRKLATAIKAATFEIIALETKIEQTRARGGPVSDADIARLEKLKAANAAATTTAAALNDRLTDQKTAGTNAALGMEVLSSRLGSTVGMMDTLKASSSGTLASLGALGLAVGGAFAAFAMAKEIISGVNEKLDEHRRKVEAAEQRIQAIKNRTAEYGVVLDQAAKGHVSYGGTLDQMKEKLLKYEAAQGNVTYKVKDWIETTSGLKIPPSLEEMQKKWEAVGLGIANAAKQGQGAWAAFMQENESKIRQEIENQRLRGQVVDESLLKNIEKFDKYKAAQLAVIPTMDELRKKGDEMAAAHEKERQAEEALYDEIRKLSEERAKALGVYETESEKKRQLTEETRQLVEKFGMEKGQADELVKQYGVQAVEIYQLSLKYQITTDAADKRVQKQAEEIKALKDQAAAEEMAQRVMENSAKLNKEIFESRRRVVDLTVEEAKAEIDRAHAMEEAAQKEQARAKTMEESIKAGDAVIAARRKQADAEDELTAAISRQREEVMRLESDLDSLGRKWEAATTAQMGFTTEVRHATKAVQETSPEFKALIEQVAQISDAFPQASIYVGGWLAQLEKGNINLTQFTQNVNSVLLSLQKNYAMTGGAFGNAFDELNRLTKALNDFKSKYGDSNPHGQGNPWNPLNPI